jgi:hypothetical protein
MPRKNPYNGGSIYKRLPGGGFQCIVCDATFYTGMAVRDHREKEHTAPGK